MKISAKLLVSFLAVALLALIVGVVGITQLVSVNSQHIELYTDRGDSQGYIGYVNSDFLKWRMYVRDMTMDKDTTKVQDYADKIKALEDDMATYLSKFGATCKQPEEKQSFDNLVAALDKYKVYRDRIIELCLAGKFDESYAVIRSQDCADVSAVADKIINDTVGNNIKIGNDVAENLSSAVNGTMWLLIGIVAVAVLGAAALGVFISRSISVPIRAVVGAADKLASGNTDIVLNIRSKDETAMLAKAMQGVVASLRKLIADANMLSDAAIEGKLKTRADASAHEGDYRKIVDGINRTLDAVIEPVNEVAAVLNEMSKGNLGVSVVGDYKGDHAAIKSAMNDTISTLKGYIGEITQALADVAGGNLNIGISSDFRGEFMAIKDSINNIIESLNSVMAEINSSAEQVASGTQQVSAGSQALSQGATEQASAIEELSSSVTDIANQTRQNAMNANQANELSASVREYAVEGNDRMKDMQQSMAEINEASSGISNIIKVIDEIAFQTNLLALNAAVEAARAGQHGKGFAVVAEEVRNLAQRSANAAKETTGMIEESIKKVKAGTQMAADTAQALNKIVEGVEKAAGLVGGIAKASNDQATAVAQVNSGIGQVSQVVQTNSATAEESAAASEELSGQAEILKDMVGRFSLKSQAAAVGQKAAPGKKAARAPAEAKPGGSGQNIALRDAEFGKY